MSARQHLHHPARKTTWGYRVLIPLALILWEVSCLLAAFILVNCTWPGNKCTEESFKASNRRQLLLQVTAGSVQTLSRAQAAVGRWQSQYASRPFSVSLTLAELKAIEQGLALAGEVTDSVFVTNAVTVGTVNRRQDSTNVLLRLMPGGEPFAVSVTATANSATPNSSTSHVATASRTGRLNRTPETTDGVDDVPRTVRMTMSANSTTMNWSTNHVVTKSRPPNLPTQGDLRGVTGADLVNASDCLARAMPLFETRLHALDKPEAKEGFLKSLGMTLGLLHRQFNLDPAVLPLTGAERAEFAKLEASLVASGTYYFCSGAFDMMMLLMAFGGIGGAVQALASLVIYLGKRRFFYRWTAFYAVRPIVGAVLAVVFYFLLGAKLMTVSLANVPGVSLPDTNATATTNAPAGAKTGGGPATVRVLDTSNVIGCCAIALLVGMFSNQATQKLERVAEGIFEREGGDKGLGDPLQGDAPSIYNTEVKVAQRLQPENLRNPEALALRLKAALPDAVQTESPTSGKQTP